MYTACWVRNSGTVVPHPPGRRPGPRRRSGRRDVGVRGRDPCTGCTRCRCLPGRPADPPLRNARTLSDVSGGSSCRRYCRHLSGTAALSALRTGGSAFVARQDVRQPARRAGHATLTGRWPHRRSTHQDATGGIERARQDAPVTASTSQSGRSAAQGLRPEVAVRGPPRCRRRCAPRPDLRGAS
jgi:hypothetical protein